MFERQLEQAIFDKSKERTNTDQVLSKENEGRLKELMMKERLTRSDFSELLYLLSSNESKLVNFSEYARYIALKFYVWIREFVKLSESLYDYQDKQDKKPTNSERIKSLMQTNQALVEHNAKFLIDLYLNMNRTTLSLGATGFIELLNNKFTFLNPTDKLAEVKREGVK